MDFVSVQLVVNLWTEAVVVNQLFRDAHPSHAIKFEPGLARVQ